MNGQLCAVDDLYQKIMPRPHKYIPPIIGHSVHAYIYTTHTCIHNIIILFQLIKQHAINATMQVLYTSNSIHNVVKLYLFQ